MENKDKTQIISSILNLDIAEDAKIEAIGLIAHDRSSPISTVLNRELPTNMALGELRDDSVPDHRDIAMLKKADISKYAYKRSE